MIKDLTLTMSTPLSDYVDYVPIYKMQSTACRLKVVDRTAIAPVYYALVLLQFDKKFKTTVCCISALLYYKRWCGRNMVWTSVRPIR